MHYYTFIDDELGVESAQILYPYLFDWFNFPTFPNVSYRAYSDADTIIAEADTLEELKLKVPFLFI